MTSRATRKNSQAAKTDIEAMKTFKWTVDEAD